MTELADVSSRAAGLNYLGGEWRPPAGGVTYTKVNPARPTETLGDFASSNEQDVDDAVAAAQSAFAEWGALPIARRAAYLESAAAILAMRTEEIARDMSN
jgi:alpha-ketoglutaric semialdehyde dehydrogenase